MSQSNKSKEDDQQKMSKFKETDDTVDQDESGDTGYDDSSDDRLTWSSRLDFLLSLLSYAVGLGNIWRFPYLCYRNGGAIFLLPYIIFLVLCGMPLFFLEAAYGQFASLSPISVWRMIPLCKGIGYGMVIVSAIVCIYYNVVIAWTLFYLVASFFPTLPWTTCDNYWNTHVCVARQRTGHDISDTVNVTQQAASGSIDTVSPATTTVTTLPLVNNVTYTITSLLSSNWSNSTAAPSRRMTASEEFWERRVLHLSEGIDSLGGLQWELVACLVAAWLVIFICLVKGVKSSGLVARFTATFPYMGMLVLLIRGVTLPGAGIGITYFMSPRWDKLFTLQLWSEAAMQMFYSVGATWGAICTLASYNHFHHNCYRDSVLVPLLAFTIGIFSGFAVFSVLGFMASETGQTVADVVTQGPGLVFVTYPEALGRMPFAQLWSVLFFTILATVGVGSQIVMFQTVVSAIVDEYGCLRNRPALLCGALCLLECLLGLVCVSEGGIYFLQIMDWYASAFSLIVLSIAECLAISWIYGADRFLNDVALMLGRRPNVWWKICWKLLTPGIVMAVLMFSIIRHTPVSYGNYVYPSWAIGLGWMFALCSMLPLPIVAILRLWQTPGSWSRRFSIQSKPMADWGRAQYRQVHASYQEQLFDSRHSLDIGKPSPYDTKDSSQPSTLNTTV